MKKLFLILLWTGIVLLILGLVSPLFLLGGELSHGIIGGAGAPSYLFLLRRMPSAVLLPAGVFLALAGAVGLVALRRKERR